MDSNLGNEELEIKWKAPSYLFMISVPLPPHPEILCPTLGIAMHVL